ncbi:gamma carbonic anhydrase family protein [Natrialbaceae archaeon A-CW2]|uniref:gamma carbonic anhydrase family protein n=1 Tax=Natronosalvus amylolyticus TaxID=2961994 RepID=UPI0020C9ADBC|nr:gamma carbonic anhydrase family protein [Natronosalvus amylolyticus]
MIRTFDGHAPTIADSAYVDETAVVIGEVTIGPNASVWPGAVLRGDHGEIVLEEGTNVQDNATIHEGARIGPRATVGHNAIVHNATVEERALVGMGAIVLDRSTIGERSIVGANSVVTEGTAVPESVLVLGAPARVKKELETDAWGAAADTYVELATRHAETGEVLERGTVGSPPDDAMGEEE